MEQIIKKPLMQDICDKDGYVEEWVVVIKKTKYFLNPYQTFLLRQEIANGNRGIIMFNKFAISIPYIEEFYMVKKYKPDQKMIENKTEEEFIPISKERFEQIKKEIYTKLGKSAK